MFDTGRRRRDRFERSSRLVITPTENGCHVLSEETQQGPFFLEELGRKNPGALCRYRQEWVESLTNAAEAEAAKTRS